MCNLIAYIKKIIIFIRRNILKHNQKKGGKNEETHYCKTWPL